MSEFLKNHNTIVASLSAVAIATGALAVEQADASRVAPLPPAVTVERDCSISPIKNGYRESCDYIQNGDLERNVTWDRTKTIRVTPTKDGTATIERRATYRTDTLFDDHGPYFIQKRKVSASSSFSLS